ncbi:hypothetical protein E3P86_03427 [Wallemia ichthyophaga]|uniref:Transmembrane protein 135 N-terminal domain-containing protein n=1 Tax=Wallemia ichthyophaga TaxID=245174 RepID=A0A4T0IUF7_WALIC|nr:hypothetical protein E3P86_03427 [Wallemia ichthyophaga]
MIDLLLTHAELRNISGKMGCSVFQTPAVDVAERPSEDVAESCGSFKPAFRASLRVLLAGSTTISTLKFLVKLLFRRDAFESVDSSLPRALALYTLANRLLGRLRGISKSWIPAISSPALLLIKQPHLRFTLALYTLSAVAEACYDLYSHLLPKGGIYDAIFSSNTIWLLSQSRLLNSFVYHPDIFPTSYAKIIFARSENYIQRRPAWVSPQSRWPSPRDVLNYIASASEHAYPKLSDSVPLLRQPVQPIIDSAHSQHTQAICAALHPAEPSCLKHYVVALFKELKGATRFSGVLAVLSALFRLKSGLKNPILTLRNIAKSTVHGAVMIGGSITTSWATTCFLQKILPNDALKKSRWCLHCIPSTLLLLTLPPKRRRQLAMYCARLTADLEWSRLGWKNNSSIECLVCLVFGVGMSVLGRALDKDKRVVGGIHGSCIRYIREGAL